jgi:beta-N-acetylhexosaminidase
MTGHLLAPVLDPDHLVTLSRDVTTGLLRERLGFTGAIVTDALEMQAVAGTVGIVEGFVQALSSGADAIESGSAEHAYLVDEIPRAVQRALREGRLAESRLADAAARTASLARPVDPGAIVDRLVVDGSARRCLEVRGTLPDLVRPVVLESRTPGGMASGELPWSLGGLVPGQDAIRVAGPDDPLPDLSGRSLVLVIRDPLRHPWQHRLLEIAAARAGSVVVDVGWPTELDVDVPLIRTRGIAPGLLAAAAELLASRVRGVA